MHSSSSGKESLYLLLSSTLVFVGLLRFQFFVPQLFPLSEGYHLRVTRDLLWLVKLLQVLLFLIRQRLSSNINRLINSRNATEPNNRTANSLIDPSQSNVGLLPTLLFGNLFDSLYNFGIDLAEALLKLWLATDSCAESFNWTSKMATSQRCPLLLLADIRSG